VTYLHLLRHAHAGDADAWAGSDASRPLTDKGRTQAERLATFLADRGFSADLVVTSPKDRAHQTAEIVADILSAPVAIDERLGDVLDLAAVEAILGEHDPASSLVLVGHDPDFSDLVSTLCGSVGVPMRKGAFARIEVERPLRAGRGTLRWLIPPDLLKPER
jgi:phosphohistidine phosphatase